MTVFNTITCNVEMVLIRQGDIIDIHKLPRKSKLVPSIYKKLVVFAKKQIYDPDYMLMYLFYSGTESFKGVDMEILKVPSLHEEKGKLVFRLQVRYIFPTPITLPELRKEVKGIFRHRRNAGDVAYDLKKFQIVSKKNVFGYLKTMGPIYHNLI